MGCLKQKRRLLFCSLSFVVLVVAVVTAWCIFFMPKDYEDIIPGQSKAVVSITFTQQSTYTQTLQTIAKQAGLSFNGFDVSRPIYLLITPNEYYALVAPVGDVASVRATVDNFVRQGKASDVHEEGGVTYAWLQKGWQMAWTRRALAIIGPGTSQERPDLRQTLRRMFKSGRKQSFRYGESYRKFNDLKGDICLFARPDALPTPLNLLLLLALPIDVDLTHVGLYASLKEQTGGLKLHLDGRFSADDATTQATLDTFFKQKLPATHSTPSVQTANALLSLTTYTPEGSLLRVFRTNPQTRSALTALDQTIDASAMLSSVSGRADFCMTALSESFSPTFSFVAQTNGTNLMHNADIWEAAAKKQKDISLVRDGTGYLLTSKGHALHFGQQDSMLYFRSTVSPLATKSVKTAEASSIIRLIARLNLQKLYQQPCVPKKVATTLQTIFSNAQQLSFSCRADGGVELVIQ